MKALVIDSAVSKLTISAKNEDKTCTCIYDIGMKQSETLLPAIEYVLGKVSVQVSELDYMALTQGPGSFTGLRLAISAVKAIECAYKTPIYGISSLLIHSKPFLESSYTVLSCIDANKDRFYAHVYKDNKEILKDGDYTTEEIITFLKDYDDILICGPDKNKMLEILKGAYSNKKISATNFNIVTTDFLYTLAEEKIKNNEPRLAEYDGPVYLRASEAEQVLRSKQEKQ